MIFSKKVCIFNFLFKLGLEPTPILIPKLDFVKEIVINHTTQFPSLSIPLFLGFLPIQSLLLFTLRFLIYTPLRNPQFPHLQSVRRKINFPPIGFTLLPLFNGLNYSIVLRFRIQSPSFHVKKKKERRHVFIQR